MKKLLVPFLVSAPLLCAASCSTIGELLDVPGAVAEDVGGVIPGVEGEPAQEPAGPSPEAIGEIAKDGTQLLTGNSILALAVGSLVTLLAGVFLKKRKTAA
jgi:hypothetical protein